jgi:hypothetical protein
MPITVKELTDFTCAHFGLYMQKNNNVEIMTPSMALSDLVEPNLHAIFLWLFFKKWGSPSLCIEEMAITTTLSLGAPLVVFFCPICRSIYCWASSTYPTRGRVLDFNTGGHHGLALGTLNLGWNPVVHARIYQPMGLQVGVS